MSSASEIRKAIQTIAGAKKACIFSAQVESVEGNTCTVSISKLKLSGVKLTCETDSENTILIKPSLNSVVLIADLSEGELRDLSVIQYSDIENITFNGGQYGGLIKVAELKENLESLKSYVEALHAALPVAFNAIGAGSAASGAAGATSYNNAMLNRSISIVDMENDKIKH